MFTNVSSPLSWNFSQDTVPEVLKDAPQYLLDNPIALQKKYLELKNNPNMKKVRTECHRAMKASEQKALEMLVDLFDWLDGLTPQPTTEIVSLYEKSQAIGAKITNTLAQMDQASAKKAEIDKLITALKKDSSVSFHLACLTLIIISMLIWKDMHAFSNFEQTVNMPSGSSSPQLLTIRYAAIGGCYSNCHIGCRLDFSLDPKGIEGCTAMKGETCKICNHSLWDHHHYRVKWEEEIDQQVSVDQDMKKKWEAAKDGKEKTTALIEAGEKALNELKQIVDHATNDLAQLAEDYANLSLSGSFSAQMEKAVRLLEQRQKGMEEKGLGQEQLQKVRDGLEFMKKKLELMNVAREKKASAPPPGPESSFSLVFLAVGIKKCPSRGKSFVSLTMISLQ
jgi:myosin heavy subunit